MIATSRDGFVQDYGTISHERYWWRVARPDGGSAFSALGNHGQFVFASPAERLIIVRTGERSGVTYFEWFELYTTIAHTVGRPTAP
jgi:CubicO group peptidase (beta-lactamase class C family)